jgi:hypothetical protein
VQAIEVRLKKGDGIAGDKRAGTVLPAAAVNVFISTDQKGGSHEKKNLCYNDHGLRHISRGWRYRMGGQRGHTG